jgi:hypothetical protein
MDLPTYVWSFTNRGYLKYIYIFSLKFLTGVQSCDSLNAKINPLHNFMGGKMACTGLCKQVKIYLEKIEEYIFTK